MSWISRTGLVAGIVATPSAPAAYDQVRRPSAGHAAQNFIPFHGASGQNCTMHQVFDPTLWSGLLEVSALGFGPWDGNNGQAYEGDIIIRLGYASKVPGQSPAVGLDSVLANNPSGLMSEVFNGRVSAVVDYQGTEVFSHIIRIDTPWRCDPAQGNLLVEIASTWVSGADLAVSRSSGSAESSRAYHSTRFGNSASLTTATRADLYEEACSGGGPTLRISVDGPGRVTVARADATPSRPMGIALANSTGSDVLRGGVFGGAQLGLNNSGPQLVYSGNTGANGSGQTSNNAGTGACGRFLQMVALDGSPCTKNNVVRIP